LRVLASTRLTANQLSSAQVAIKRKIKPIKGAECFLRVFPDVPVCVKGNETRMGKGKGSFEYWACRWVRLRDLDSMTACREHYLRRRLTVDNL
jgi:ribosomal protein L16